MANRWCETHILLVHEREFPVTVTDTVRDFYAALGSGDIGRAMSLMTDDIEWTTMMDYKIAGRGPKCVAEGMLIPLVAEWSSFALSPTELIAGDDGHTVVSVGHFSCVHGSTGKRAEAGYVHIWTVHEGKIARYRQYIDTLAMEEARRPSPTSDS